MQLYKDWFSDTTIHNVATGYWYNIEVGRFTNPDNGRIISYYVIGADETGVKCTKGFTTRKEANAEFYYQAAQYIMQVHKNDIERDFPDYEYASVVFGRNAGMWILTMFNPTDTDKPPIEMKCVGELDTR